MPINDDKQRTTAITDKVMLGLSVLCTLVTLGWVLWYCRYGFDFTDEGFYLVWMSNPYNYNVSATQFGYIYHPLFELLDGNIAVLRQANALITFCLSWLLGNIFLKTVFGNKSLLGIHRIIISAAFATTAVSSLVYAGLWLPTPSYNSLALKALLVAAVGLLLADKHISRASIIGWFLIGASGWLAFMSKPTTAAALGFCAGSYLLFARKFNARLLVIPVITSVGLIVLSAVVIDGSIITFVDRLKNGVEMYRILGGGHTNLFRFDDLQLGGRGFLIFVACTVAFYSAAYFSQVNSKSLKYSGTILSITFVVVILAIVLRIVNKTLHVGQFQGLLIWSVPFAAILAGLTRYRLDGLLRISRENWLLMLAFMMLPYVYAFGTNGNYWFSAAVAGLFWVLAGLVFLNPIANHPKFLSLLLSLGFAVQMITVILVQGGFETPYRQPQPLRANNYELVIGRPGSSVILSKGFGQYVAEAIGAARNAGFKKGMPVIDLTGQSPGVLYSLGASNIGQVWTVGGYPGSEALAVMMLKKVACQELASAWLLTEPEGPRKLSPDILMSFGANMATDFEVVGRFKTAEGVGGYNEVQIQQLLKPIRFAGDAISACTAGRTPNKLK